MITLFENNDFILKSTGNDYDFVGIIETKTNKPLTFFFAEEIVYYGEYGDDEECDVCEYSTEFLEVYEDMDKPDEEGNDEIEENANALLLGLNDGNHNSVSYFTTRDDGYTGFMSDCRERGWFRALIKAYCPDRLKDVHWA